MAKLVGYATPFVGVLEHTYVASDDGYSWECFGSNTGGRVLCLDDGDSSIADCLSYNRNYASGTNAMPGISTYADITYGVHGVCHQASNRILYATGAAGVTVASAKGYPWSQFLYGTYGSEGVPWPRLAHCGTVRSLGVVMKRIGDKTTQLGLQVPKPDAQRDSRAPISMAAIAEQESRALQELQALFDKCFGPSVYDRHKIADVAEYQRNFRERRHELAAKLAKHEIGPEQFAVLIKGAIKDTADECERVLGSADFERVFGVSSESAANLI